MSTVKANNHQIGQSGTATNNFTLYQPSTPDGTVRLAVGNSGATTGDVLSVSNTGLSVTGTLSATGNVSFDGGTFVFNESGADKDFRIEGDTDANLFFTDASTDRVGIGTSSPGSKLTVSGDIQIQSTNYLSFSNTAQQTYIRAAATSTLAFGTNSTEQMRLDSSGNLGLGVTPSAWQSGYTVFQARNTSIFTSSTTDLNFGQNVYINSGGNYTYISNGYATLYNQYLGKHFWSTAPSGTAGNAITFTQAMTLDASGNLGVGNTNPSAPVDIQANSGGTGIRIRGRASANAGALRFFANDNTTQRARFESNDTSFEINSIANLPITISTNDTERARITSGGYFKASNAGTYQDSTAAYHELRTNGSDWTAIVSSANATAGNCFGIRIFYSAASPNGAGNSFLNCADWNGTVVTTRAEFLSNGGLANYQGNDANLSDRREKTNFAPAKSYLNTICAIPVQTFNYIDQSEDDPGLTLGVVAQDVQAVAPELVMESNWGTKEDPKMRLSIYQTDLQYALMKCIQELKAQNDELRARVALLEGTQP